MVAFLYAEVQSSFILLLHHPPELWSPTLLPPATSFVEDNFSVDGDGVGWEWVDGIVQAVMRSMGSGR